jgi:hypothetical protein
MEPIIYAQGPWTWEQTAANSVAVVDATGAVVAEIIAENELRAIDGAHIKLLAKAPELLFIVVGIMKACRDYNGDPGTARDALVAAFDAAVPLLDELE